jgi:hypothetical protein
MRPTTARRGTARPGSPAHAARACSAAAPGAIRRTICAPRRAGGRRRAPRCRCRDAGDAGVRRGLKGPRSGRRRRQQSRKPFGKEPKSASHAQWDCAVQAIVCRGPARIALLSSSTKCLIWQRRKRSPPSRQSAPRVPRKLSKLKRRCDVSFGFVFNCRVRGLGSKVCPRPGPRGGRCGQYPLQFNVQ